VPPVAVNKTNDIAIERRVDAFNETTPDCFFELMSEWDPNKQLVVIIGILQQHQNDGFCLLPLLGQQSSEHCTFRARQSKNGLGVI
jgi:hypothetical protein